jgi:hypothetical protein
MTQLKKVILFTDAAVHGHWSRQVGPDPLVTLFVRD